MRVIERGQFYNDECITTFWIRSIGNCLKGCQFMNWFAIKYCATAVRENGLICNSLWKKEVKGNQANYTFRKSYFWKILEDKFNIIFSHLLRQRLRLLNKLYLRFIDGLEVEIQIFSKVVQKSLGPVSPLICTLKSCRAEYTMGKIHGTGPTRFSTSSDNGLYLSF